MGTELRVDVAIVGGGVLGSSIAWHLTRGGVERVALIERRALGSGASALSAGLVSHARSDPDVLSMVRSTLEDIATLEAVTGQPIGYRRTSSLRLAERPETASQLERMAEQLRIAGVDASFVDARRARELVPWLDPGSAVSILHVPDDGYVDGQGLATAYAQAARVGGATVRAGTSALAPRVEGGRLVGVETSRGRIRCAHLVDAAGPWAGNVLGWLGLGLAATLLRSHYWITSPATPPWPEHPIVALPDAHAYIRPEVGGLLVGVQERASRTFDDRCLPADLSELALTGPEDWDLLDAHAPGIRRHLPAFDDLEFRHHLAGITTYTPDGRFLIGPVPGFENLILAGGCCGTGLSCAGGIGRLVRDLVFDRRPEVSAGKFRPSRFGTTDFRSDDFVAQCVASRASKGRRS